MDIIKAGFAVLKSDWKTCSFHVKYSQRDLFNPSEARIHGCPSETTASADYGTVAQTTISQKGLLGFEVNSFLST